MGTENLKIATSDGRRRTQSVNDGRDSAKGWFGYGAHSGLRQPTSDGSKTAVQGANGCKRHHSAAPCGKIVSDHAPAVWNFFEVTNRPGLPDVE